MLTLQETIKAINALDTAPDIIRNACDKILSPNKDQPTELDSSDIALEICKKYSGTHDTSKVLLGICTAVATLAAVICKPGKEDELLKALTALLYDQFAEVMAKKFMRRFATDPKAASAQLLEMLNSINKR